MKQNESELVARTLDGDEQAYAELIDRYKEGLYRHCFRFTRDEDDAEDLAQQAFINVYVHLDQYDVQFRFSTWLYKIATNLGLMYIRKRRDIRLEESELDRIVSDLPPTEQLALNHELQEAIGELPANYQTVVSSYYWQGKSYDEIAAAMDAPVGTVKSWMNRAKKQLKEVLS